MNNVYGGDPQKFTDKVCTKFTQETRSPFTIYMIYGSRKRTVIDLLLFNTKRAICQLYHGENKLHLMR